MRASTSPWATVWPIVTLSSVTVPAMLKARPRVCAGSTVPAADTTCVTVPRRTTAVDAAAGSTGSPRLTITTTTMATTAAAVTATTAPTPPGAASTLTRPWWHSLITGLAVGSKRPRSHLEARSDPRRPIPSPH